MATQKCTRKAWSAKPSLILLSSSRRDVQCINIKIKRYGDGALAPGPRPRAAARGWISAPKLVARRQIATHLKHALININLDWCVQSMHPRMRLADSASSPLHSYHKICRYGILKRIDLIADFQLYLNSKRVQQELLLWLDTMVLPPQSIQNNQANIWRDVNIF